MSNSRKTCYLPGDYVISKSGKHFWPAIVLDPSQINSPLNSAKQCWVYWFGDGRVSKLCHNILVPLQKLFDGPRYTKHLKKHPSRIQTALLEALQCYWETFLPNESPCEDLLKWAQDGFLGISDHEVQKDIPEKVLRGLKQLSRNSESINLIIESPKKAGSLRRYKKMDNKEFCLACYSENVIAKHPVFDGGVCENCEKRLLKSLFLIGHDNIHYCCWICGSYGDMVICSHNTCGKGFCHMCIVNLGSESLKKFILNLKEWSCFLCSFSNKSKSRGQIISRDDWRLGLQQMFDTNPGFLWPPIPSGPKPKIRVLSLFDGIATGLVALKSIGLEVEVYYAAELDFNSKMVALYHHKDQLKYLGTGDVQDLDCTLLETLSPIHLILGGSPCQELSLANPCRSGLFSDLKGTGILFFDFCRILKFMRKVNSGKFFWLYENVSSMTQEASDIISRHLECEPIVVDSINVSPQRRQRYFWGNCPSIQTDFSELEGPTLQQYLEPHRIAKLNTVRTITTHSNSLTQGPDLYPVFDISKGFQNLTIEEMEKVFGFPKGYTNIRFISNTARLTLLGKAWSVQTICMLLRFLRLFHEIKQS